MLSLTKIITRKIARKYLPPCADLAIASSAWQLADPDPGQFCPQRYIQDGTKAATSRFTIHLRPGQIVWRCTVSRLLSGVPSRFRGSCAHIMALTPTNDSTSIFKDEKLRPGIYMIQNIVSQTCVDIQGYTGELCGRPAAVLEGKGLVGPCFHWLPPSHRWLYLVGNSPFGTRIYHTQGTVLDHVSLCRALNKVP